MKTEESNGPTRVVLKGMGGRITLTKRMLSKSIIDANKSITVFLKEHVTLSGYDDIGNGEKVVHNAVLSTFDAQEVLETTITLYRRPRGDKLLSIQNLSKLAKEGDTVMFDLMDGDIWMVVHTPSELEEAA